MSYPRGMVKLWKHLIEADSREREAEKRWIGSGDTDDYIAYINVQKRSGGVIELEKLNNTAVASKNVRKFYSKLRPRQMEYGNHNIHWLLDRLPGILNTRAAEDYHRLTGITELPETFQSLVHAVMFNPVGLVASNSATFSVLFTETWPPDPDEAGALEYLTNQHHAVWHFNETLFMLTRPQRLTIVGQSRDGFYSNQSAILLKRPGVLIYADSKSMYQRHIGMGG